MFEYSNAFTCIESYIDCKTKNNWPSVPPYTPTFAYGKFAPVISTIVVLKILFSPSRFSGLLRTCS